MNEVIEKAHLIALNLLATGEGHDHVQSLARGFVELLEEVESLEVSLENCLDEGLW